MCFGVGVAGYYANLGKCFLFSVVHMDVLDCLCQPGICFAKFYSTEVKIRLKSVWSIGCSRECDFSCTHSLLRASIKVF